MNLLPKEILNYFATFTETRFNFRRLINYKWTDNELTLDTSFFPQFQEHLLEKVKSGDLSPITIKKNEDSINIPKEQIVLALDELLSKENDIVYLEKCIQEEISLIDNNSLDEKTLSLKKDEALKEGLRNYNLTLRRKFEASLIKLQEEIVNEKKNEYGIENTPPSIFGVTNYVNQHFEKVKLLSQEYKDERSYIDLIKKYFDDILGDIVIYDLFYNIQKYEEFSKLGTLYLFFHQLKKDNDSFPIYFLEAEIKSATDEITISFPRDLVLLNIPAVNYFKFENVLTLPRAVSTSKVSSHLGSVETFFQNQYGFQSPFILEPTFNGITHTDKSLPSIKARIGFQTIEKEDKKLLDYSELMTSIEMGETSKFAEFIDQYIKGTVPNHQEEVDTIFRDEYNISSPKRYISESPIPLNQTQKRILLALANEKNKIIVVDGPPGTGKSHTISALTYWANEKKKSVVITSHKKEALDVIDRMLTDKFKDLHPQAKPSLVRMDQNSGSDNNLLNTLQTSVVAAANERALNFNEKAIENDEASISERIEEAVMRKLDQGKDYKEYIQKVVVLDLLESELSAQPNFQDLISNVNAPTELDAEVIIQFINSNALKKLGGLSLEEYQFIVNHLESIPSFLEACEKLYQIDPEKSQAKLLEIELPDDFTTMIAQLKANLNPDITIDKLSIKDRTRGLLGAVFNRGISDEELNKSLAKLKSLEYSKILEEIAKNLDRDTTGLTIGEIYYEIEKNQTAQSIEPYRNLIASYQALPGNSLKTVSDIYQKMKEYGESKDFFSVKILNTLIQLFSCYSQVLDTEDITKNNLLNLAKVLNPDSSAGKKWRWITLHSEASQNGSHSLQSQDIDAHYRLKQKEVEYLNDQRLKDLNNHLGEIARIKVSYEGGKRFSDEEAKVLLNAVSGIIAEPSIISKHFPMKEDLIDILIIDEASQVSIADSISLILRAKQVVIFGDEYQYGAVSAINVSSKYSASYFNEIISAYSEDYNASVSDQAKKELVDEVSKDQDPEEAQSDTLLKPQEGTVLWLKTFNIRTSTLTFTKAIANYTTSLKEHFRSFPEIIGYSNDYFYKLAQMELLVNRIRTKPIGEVLQFLEVQCQGKSGANVNLDEIEAIGNDIKKRLDNGFKGTVGIITSFKEQQARLEEYLNEHFNMPVLRRDHKLAIWFVGDVQGEERDVIYYSFVEVRDLGNANLTSIYPVIGGTADNIRSLKMQRLNVGFSRAKDTMIFVHSQPLEQFSTTRLGDALKHYKETLEANKANDFFIEDESVFGSPMEKKLYALLLETKFVKENRDKIKIVPQFDIGKYIAHEYAVSIPKYRTDFLLTYTDGGKEKVLILEYDGVEYHFKNPSEVDQINFSQEYLEYDVSRQLELESYGYSFLRLNKFNLRPTNSEETEVDVLNDLLSERLN